MPERPAPLLIEKSSSSGKGRGFQQSLLKLPRSNLQLRRVFLFTARVELNGDLIENVNRSVVHLVSRETILGAKSSLDRC